VQDTLDAVETLLKKHEAFERAAATQEERFLALERITTVSGRYCFFAALETSTFHHCDISHPHYCQQHVIIPMVDQ